MHFIYVYSGCSPKKYEEYIEKKGLRVQQQSQKYNQLLMEGLCANGAKVDAVSSRPINRAVDSRVLFKSEKDSYGGINYHYVPFLNFPVLRNISVFFSIFFKTLFMKTDKQRVVVCDALNIVASFAALLACKIRGIKAIGIVTDVPCHRPNNVQIPLHEKINLWLMKKFEGYLLLTEQMNDIVNPKKCPYIVMEGHADISMSEVKNELSDKYEKKVCFYAGTLRRVYGIGNLVHGFIKANVPETELHIYGSGDFEQELKKLCEEHSNVKYFGVAPNKEIVENELKCALLVNPRPTNEDYTKYSFPSKNMEYMASGTPVLTTKLPGMPKEYDKYVYLIDEETEDGVCEKLKEILSQPADVLHKKGLLAKEFILQEKNNVVQAENLIQMIIGEMKI